MIRELFFRPVDAASLAVFRIVFGALMLFESVNYGVFLCLDCMYRETDLLFKYHHFEWARMLPGPGLELVFVVMGLAATGVMLGLFYRFSAIVLVLTFGYLFLLDQALYLNHFYLALLFATILVFVPAHRYASLDARRRPDFASATVPNWGRFWLGAQLEIVLLYAGFVKVTNDWMNLEPMRLWMNNASVDEPALFQWLTQDAGIAAASYGAIALHLIGAPLLLWRKTRFVVFWIYAVFHTINAFVFNIGIFPWMTLGATLLLFDPDWPRQVLRWFQARGKLLRYESFARPVEIPASGASALAPAVSGPATATGEGRREKVAMTGPAPQPGSVAGATPVAAQFISTPWRIFIVTGVCLWLALQITVPLRHHVAPGNVAWNEDGHRFSWRMKLRSKRGKATFYVQRDDGFRLVVDPATHLNRKQVRKMACIPDLLWQFAEFLEEEHSEDGRFDVAVYVDTLCSLNTREPAPLVDRLVDLTTVERGDPVTTWVTPLSKPLPNPLF